MPAIKHDRLLLRMLKDLQDVRSALRRVTTNLPLYDINNENTPNQITSDQDDYVIGNYDALRLSSDAVRTITGLKRGVKGRSLRIFNIGDFAIVLAHQDASSTAEYRFKFSNGSAAVVPPGSNLIVYYDSTEERWIGGDTYSSGAVFSSIRQTNPMSIPHGASATKIDWDLVVKDQYDFFDAATDAFIIPFDGFYKIWSSAEFSGEASANGYQRLLTIVVNRDGGLIGTWTSQATQEISGGICYMRTSTELELEVGDIITFTVTQYSPTAANMNLINGYAGISRMT